MQFLGIITYKGHFLGAFAIPSSIAAGIMAVIKLGLSLLGFVMGNIFGWR